MASSGKRTIKGFKTFEKPLKLTGKYGLKALAKAPELLLRGGSKLIGALANTEQFQVIATTGGLIAASVAFPPVGLGIAGLTIAKYYADKMLGTKTPDGKDKSLLSVLRDTIMLGNNITKLACDKVISPAMRFVDDKSQELGQTAQDKIDDLFDGR